MLTTLTKQNNKFRLFIIVIDIDIFNMKYTITETFKSILRYGYVQDMFIILDILYNSQNISTWAIK